MYQPTEIVLPSDLCDQLWEVAQHLHFGAAASFMTDFEKTYILASHVLPYFPNKTLKQITCVGLRPSQQIVGHRDAPITAVRYHLPIATNDHCWVHHNGTWQQLQLGSAYTMDPTLWHGAVNWGETLRVHVMIDLL